MKCAIFVSLCFLGLNLHADFPSAQIVKSANAFLTTLKETQKKDVLFSFEDERQRARWSNFPTAVVTRGGMSLKDMNPQQRAAAMALVASVLSEEGFRKIQQIMDGDEANKIEEMAHPHGPPPHHEPDGKHGGPPPPGMAKMPPGGFDPKNLFGKDLYYISILGTPSETTPWMLQFGGHHLALNITMIGERGVLTPTLTAAQPASYKSGDKTVRPLGNESDKGLALLNSLQPLQKKKAVLDSKLSDLVLGPGQDGKVIQPEGLKATAMTQAQRALLVDLIREWVGIIQESEAKTRMREIQSELDQTWFLWSGPTTGAPGSNISAYYRIQGPHVIIEYAPQGDDPAMHVHTMYRDPTNDYGRALIKK